MLLRKSKAEGSSLSHIEVKKQCGTPDALISTHIHGHHPCAHTCVRAHTQRNKDRDRELEEHTDTQTDIYCPWNLGPFKIFDPNHPLGLFTESNLRIDVSYLHFEN